MIQFDYFDEIALAFPPQQPISGKSAEARRQLPYPEPCKGGFHTGGHDERCVSTSFGFTLLIRASGFLAHFSKNVAILLQVADHLLQLTKGLIVSRQSGSGMHLACTRGRMDRVAKSASARSLYDFPVHSNLRIRLISGNWEVRRSFNQLGLFEGDRVRVVWKAPFGGPVILEARGAKVAIGKQLAQMIRVEALT
jgi:Fe2+ transport system protein FeoA